MTHLQINGVNIIRYNPTGLEQIQNKIEAMKIKEILEKELESSGSKLGEKISSEQVLGQLREILEITERGSLQDKIEATGCEY